MKEGGVLYLDQAKIHLDKKFRTIEAVFAAKKIQVKYLPPNATWLISPLDQQPFARLRELWNKRGAKTASTALFTLCNCNAAVSLKAVQKGIKKAGF